MVGVGAIINFPPEVFGLVHAEEPRPYFLRTHGLAVLAVIRESNNFPLIQNSFNHPPFTGQWPTRPDEGTATGGNVVSSCMVITASSACLTKRTVNRILFRSIWAHGNGTQVLPERLPQDFGYRDNWRAPTLISRSVCSPTRPVTLLSRP